MLKIRKRISLAFLGQEYAENYIELNAVSMAELKPLMEKVQALQRNEEAGEALQFMTDEVGSRFVSGKISQDGKEQDITKEDLESLPAEVFIEAFQEITGKFPKA